METINTEKAPAAIGAYNQAVKHLGIVYVSGQLGVDPQSGEFAEGLEAQTMRILENLSAISEAAGAVFKDTALKLTVYMTNLGDFSIVNQCFTDFFSNHLPARATVEVSRLPKDAQIEIDAVVAMP